MSKSIFNNFSVLNFFFFITGNKWENFLQYICDLRTIDTKGLIEPTRWQFSCYWKEFSHSELKWVLGAFSLYFLRNISMIRELFHRIFSLSTRMFFLCLRLKGYELCMFTGEKVTVTAFSVNIGFISVKDVAESAAIFDTMWDRQRVKGWQLWLVNNRYDCVPVVH